MMTLLKTMKPPLKTAQDCKELYQALQEGIIDTVGTDHAPHTKEEKLASTTYGIPGVETMLPLLLNEVSKGILTLSQIQSLCAEKPATIFNITHKGFIREGWDADLTIIDMNCVKQVDATKLFSKSKWTPFDGAILKGWPIMTIVNGTIVFDGAIQSENAGKEVQFDV